MEIELLKQMPLFDGIDDEGLQKLIDCINPSTAEYIKNALIYSEGDASAFGIILSGSVRIITSDHAGNTEIAEILKAGDFFGEQFALFGGNSTITTRAAEPSRILFIDGRKLTVCCHITCDAHLRLINNLIGLLVRKSAEKTEKLYILNKPTTREKLWAYLGAHAKKAGSSRFKIPLNRAQLADYLCVDRSAMSRELSAMRDSGMLEFYKNSFVLNEL